MWLNPKSKISLIIHLNDQNLWKYLIIHHGTKYTKEKKKNNLQLDLKKISCSSNCKFPWCINTKCYYNTTWKLHKYKEWIKYQLDGEDKKNNMNWVQKWERDMAKISTGWLYCPVGSCSSDLWTKIRGMLKGKERKKAKRGVCTYPPVYLR